MSSSGAIPNCEYLIHKSHALIHTLFTLPLTAERHFCSIFKHKSLCAVASASLPMGLPGRRCYEGYEPERGFISRKLSM